MQVQLGSGFTVCPLTKMKTLESKQVMDKIFIIMMLLKLKIKKTTTLLYHTKAYK